MSPLSCPLPLESAGLTDRQIRQLAADRHAAAGSVSAADVAADLTEAAADTARRLGLNPNDPRALGVLLTLARRSYSHGHMDCAEQARELAVPPLALLLGRRVRIR